MYVRGLYANKGEGIITIGYGERFYGEQNLIFLDDSVDECVMCMQSIRFYSLFSDLIGLHSNTILSLVPLRKGVDVYCRASNSRCDERHSCMEGDDLEDEGGWVRLFSEYF
jgi:hypothetical protein